MTPAQRAPQDPGTEGVGPPILSIYGSGAPRNRVCTHVSPRSGARVPAAAALPGTPRAKPRPAAAGGDSEGDLQGGGGPVEGPARCNPDRRGEKAAVPAEPRPSSPLSARYSLHRQTPRCSRPNSPAEPGRPLPPACELGSRALSAGAAAGNSSVLMTMAAGSGVRLNCPCRPPRH